MSLVYMKKSIKILAIETSCDETAAAVLEFQNSKVEILSDLVSSQVKVHAKFGGIVPEVAARLQMEQVLPIVNGALEEAKVKPKDLNAIAFTGGPGLITSLLVGAETAKTLAYAWDKPLIKINHLEGHVYSSLINEDVKFPALCLIVSGGHTELIYMKKHGDYERIGGTRDDAVGEAFDKVAKMLNLGYPGGPIIAAQAAKFRALAAPFSLRDTTADTVDSPAKVKNASSLRVTASGGRQNSNSVLPLASLKLRRSGYPTKSVPFRIPYQAPISLPRPMLDTGDFEMSFSGLKTAVLHALSKFKKITDEIKIEMCYEFQEAVTDVLVYKTLDAAQKLNVKSLILGGGVSANQALRAKLLTAVKNQAPRVKVYLPEIKYTGDNAVMIGLAAYHHYKKKDFISSFGFRAEPNWELV